MTGWPRFRTGLNPYGLTYHLGPQASGTARANPGGQGLDAFIALGADLGARVLAIFDPWLSASSDDELRALKDRLAGLAIETRGLRRARHR